MGMINTLFRKLKQGQCEKLAALAANSGHCDTLFVNQHTEPENFSDWELTAQY